MKVNGIDLDEYKLHPRLLELRVVMIHHIIAKEYDLNVATNLFRILCDMFRIDWQKVNGIISQQRAVRRMYKTDRLRFRQELVLMGACNNEARYYIAERYLNLNKTTIYRKEMKLKMSDFISERWLEELDENVVICGIPIYRFEAERFLTHLDIFLGALGRVSISKIQL
jgi:hypothetical protein